MSTVNSVKPGAGVASSRMARLLDNSIVALATVCLIAAISVAAVGPPALRASAHDNTVQAGAREADKAPMRSERDPALQRIDSTEGQRG